MNIYLLTSKAAWLPSWITGICCFSQSWQSRSSKFMPACDLSVEKPVSTAFSKLLHSQSWVELASHPKSWRQHVSRSLAFSSRQSPSVLHSPDINQCRDGRCLRHFDSGHRQDVENQGWSPCFRYYWSTQQGKGLAKEAENPFLF